jgi:hypothetical protein
LLTIQGLPERSAISALLFRLVISMWKGGTRKNSTNTASAM